MATTDNRPSARDDVQSRRHPQAPPISARGAPCHVVQLPALTSRGPSSALSGDGTAEAGQLAQAFAAIDEARRAGVQPSAAVIAARDALIAAQVGVKPANDPARS